MGVVVLGRAVIVGGELVWGLGFIVGDVVRYGNKGT